MRSQLYLRTALAALMFIAAARVSFAVNCGDTITTDETLTANLNCTMDPALIVDEGGSLDLNGFSVTCNGTQYGIVLDADKTSISNGSIGDCSEVALTLAGNGHKVAGIYIFSSGTGIHAPTVDATGIKIKDVAVVGVSSGIDIEADGTSISGASISALYRGVALRGTGNKVKDVTIVTQGEGLYSLGGGGDKVSDLRVAGAYTSVFTDGSNSKFSQIHSLDHEYDGITISSGNDNKVSGSTFLGEGSIAFGVDLLDGAGNSASKCTTLGGSLGIYTAADASEITKNHLFGASNHGIFVLSSDSTIKSNVGLGSGIYDFEDTSPGCMNDNVWDKNLGKKNQSCVE